MVTINVNLCYVLSFLNILLGIAYLYISVRLIKSTNSKDRIAKYAFILIGLFPILMGIYLGLSTYYFYNSVEPIILADSIEVIAQVLE